MFTYLLVFFICIVIGLTYVLVFWQILKRLTKSDIPSPFAFGKNFWFDLKKFGIVYLLGDTSRFIIEIFILGTKNAIVVRLVGIVLTLTTSGFFGRWRSLALRKIKHDTKKYHKFWEFMGDTFASLVFWVPMYIAQVMILLAFDLTHRSNAWNSVYLVVGSILLFGRFGCIMADLVEKLLLKKTKGE